MVFNKLKNKYETYQRKKDKKLVAKLDRLKTDNAFAKKRSKLRAEYAAERKKARSNSFLGKLGSSLAPKPQKGKKLLPKAKTVSSNKLFAFDKPSSKEKKDDWLEW